MCAAEIESVDAVWRDHGAEDDWFIVEKGMRHGDFFLALSLMDAFRHQHVGPRRLICLTTQEKTANIARMFPAVDVAHVVPRLNQIPIADIHAWNSLGGRDPFGPGRLILLHHTNYTVGGFLQGGIVGAGVCELDLFRVALRLRISAATVQPPSPAGPEARAEAIGQGVVLRPGRTVILFPYAQSFHRDWTAHLEHLAARLVQSGLSVFTAVAGREAPIAGTRPVSIPFEQLRPVVDLAGYAVVVRSGIADMLFNASARVVVLYPSQAVHDTWNSGQLGLDSNAIELYPRPDLDEPKRFAETLRTLLLEADPSAYPRGQPAGLGAFFRLSNAHERLAGGGPVRLNTTTDFVRLGAVAAFPGLALGRGWDLEPWGCWSVGSRADMLIPVQALTGKVWLDIDALAAISPHHPSITITVTEGGRVLHRQVFSLETGRARPMTVPLAGFSPAMDIIRLVIHVDRPASPHEQTLGKHADRRPIGIGIRAVTLKMAEP